MNILEKLWSGNICPCEEEGCWPEECSDLRELFNRNHGELCKTLNREEQETLEKLCGCWEELQRYAECDSFIQGFRLGVQLMAASMCNAPNS